MLTITVEVLLRSTPTGTLGTPELIQWRCSRHSFLHSTLSSYPLTKNFWWQIQFWLEGQATQDFHHNVQGEWESMSGIMRVWLCECLTMKMRNVCNYWAHCKCGRTEPQTQKCKAVLGPAGKNYTMSLDRLTHGIESTHKSIGSVRGSMDLWPHSVTWRWAGKT